MKGEAAPDAILGMVQGAFDGIGGIGPITATMEHGCHLTVRFTGWGPTLHERRFTLGVDLSEFEVERAAEDGSALEHHVTYELMSHAQGQRTLSAMGQSAGLHAPMARPGDLADPETSGHSIGHLRVDLAVLAALLGAMPPARVAEHLVDAVSDAIGGDADEMDQDVHAGSDPGAMSLSYPCATDDEERVDIRTRHDAQTGGCQCVLHISRKIKGAHGGTIATVVARAIRLEPEILAAIPDTLAAVYTGRPLGDLVATGCPELDAMPVIGFSDSGDGIDVGLASERIRLADHPLIGGHVALPGGGA